MAESTVTSSADIVRTVDETEELAEEWVEMIYDLIRDYKTGLSSTSRFVVIVIILVLFRVINHLKICLYEYTCITRAVTSRNHLVLLGFHAILRRLKLAVDIRA